jgi:hypothetical protein
MAASLVLSGAAVARGQSAYFRAVTNLNPAGYWPMHEVEAPAPGNIETNYGTLGALGNGYYNDWTALPSATAAIVRQVPGPVVNPADTGAYFTNTAERVATAGCLLVPNISSALTLTPPFTIEGWAEASHYNSTLSSMVSQGGGAGLNNSSSYSGWSLNWNTLSFGSSGTIFNMYAYGGPGSGTITGCEGASSTLAQSNVWYYFAYVFTTPSNATYCVANTAVNGPSGTLTPPLPPTSWSPVFLANGRNGNTGPGSFSFDGALAEVAIYTNALAAGDFSAHYNAATSANPPTNYFQLITSYNPLIYLRMNAPAYTVPNLSTWPALTNYGSVAANGVYTPGTVPGILTGISANGYPVNVSNQVPLLSAMGTFADAGNNSSYNPTGASATFSVSALFRGNPADPRVQSIVGHGTNSWMLGLTTSGTVVFNSGTNSAAAATGTAAGDLVGTATSNDGFWHYVVAVHNQTTNFLYVDGALVATNVSTASIPGNTQHVMIGADPSYTNVNDNLGRQLLGQVCEVAFFTNALAASDVQTLYTDLGVIPVITRQPISTNVNAGTAFTNTVAVNGSPTLAYRWYFNTSSNYSGASTVTNTADGRVTGATSASLVITNVHGSDAGYYFVAVTNNYGAVTSTVVSLTVFTSPVLGNQLPVPYTNLYTLYAGSSPTFSIASVSGAAPIYCQWYTNGAKVASATNLTCQLHNLPVGGITTYCVVTNFVGATTSFVWTATVVAAPTAPYPQAVLGLTPIGYWRLNEMDDGNGNQGAIAHDYVEGNDGIYTNTDLDEQGYSQGLATQYNYSPATDPTETSALFGNFNTPNSAANSIAGVDFSAPTNTSVVFTVEAWAEGTGQASGNTGIASKDYFNNEEFTLDTGAPNKCYRFEVRSANGTAYNANSTLAASDSLWHHLVGVCDESNGVLNLYIDGLLAVSTNIPTGSGLIASDATVPMVIGARPTSATSGDDNQFYGYVNDVAIFGYALSPSQVDAQYNAAGVPPYFTQQPPANTNASGNTTLTIPAADSGTAPVTNQWWDATAGAPLAGQTNATLVISNVPGSLDTHQLFLIAANAYGTNDSSEVTLSIYTAPQIITDLPAQIVVPAGKPCTYVVSVIGSPPLSFQWYSNNVPVAGQTRSNYSFAAVSASYDVVITNHYGAATSTVSVLTAMLPPRIPYATNILITYGAVGYWPLQETNPPAPANMETNYGTLGALGNAYYAATNASVVTFGQTGALPNDTDTAVAVSGPASTDGITSYAFVPRVSPALTLQPPFTWEVWVNPSGTAFGDILAYGAGSGLNGGNWAGLRLSWGGNFQIYACDGTSATSFTASFSTPDYPAGQWHYCAVTYDGTTASVYVDGSSSPVASAAITMAIDTWTPLCIGNGRWQSTGPTRNFSGLIDEVAVYTNLLLASDLTTHYNDGLSGGSGAYKADVLAKHPLLYYRMDCPGFTNPSPSLYPIAMNFGSSLVNGAYRPGIVPGGVSGPPDFGFGTNEFAAPINGNISCVDAGYDPLFNPTGTKPFSAAMWFKTYPSDGRVQAVMSHGTNWAMILDGTTGHLVWDLNSAGNVTSTGILNDGDWHFAVGVYDGAYNYLYTDGALNISAAATGQLASDTNANLFLGGNADFTVVGGNQQYFAGALAQAAFFTNALTAAQVSQLYSDAGGGPPTISLERSGNNLIITYTGTLLSSTNVTGPYSTVTGASSPSYTTSPTNAQMFYRARQ